MYGCVSLCRLCGVSGFILREIINGIYLFPLPEGLSLTSRVIFGGRVFVVFVLMYLLSFESSATLTNSHTMFLCVDLLQICSLPPQAPRRLPTTFLYVVRSQQDFLCCIVGLCRVKDVLFVFSKKF